MIGAIMTEEKTKPEHKVITLRMPPSFYDRLATLAANDRRSLNAEALVLLDEAMAEREKEAKK